MPIAMAATSLPRPSAPGRRSSLNYVIDTVKHSVARRHGRSAPLGWSCGRTAAAIPSSPVQESRLRIGSTEEARARIELRSIGVVASLPLPAHQRFTTRLLSSLGYYQAPAATESNASECTQFEGGASRLGRGPLETSVPKSQLKTIKCNGTPWVAAAATPPRDRWFALLRIRLLASLHGIAATASTTAPPASAVTAER